MALIDPSGKTLTANGTVDGSHPLADAFDQNGATYGRVTDAGGNPWFQIDLGESYICTALYWQESMTARPDYSNTKLRVSQNGTDWTDAYTFTTWYNQPVTLPENTAGRYWRIEGTSWTSAWDVVQINLDGAPGGGPVESMEITPDPVWVGGGLVVLTATGTYTDWDPDNQLDTVFSVDYGTLSAQHIESATVVTLYYTPDDYLGPITFTETKYGLEDQINSTVIPPEGGAGGACPFDQDFIDTANATVLADNRGLPTLQSIIVPAAQGWGNVYLQEAIADLWYSHFRPEFLDPDQQQAADRIAFLWQILNGSVSPPTGPFASPPSEPIHNTIMAIRDWLNPGGNTYTDLADVVELLGGTPTIYSNADIMTAIGNLSAGSNQDVLDALAAYFGTNPPTIRQLGDMLSDIATIAGYTLGDVLDAIADTQSAVASVGTTVSTISTNLTNGVQAILDAIGAIPAPVAPVQAPIWPGLASVTLGTPTALLDSMDIAGPMDGLIVAASGADAGTAHYTYHDVKAYRNVGALAFYTDRGDIEPFQTLGFEAAIYTPRTMVRAGGAKLFTSRGLSGTVRTWTIP